MTRVPVIIGDGDSWNKYPGFMSRSNIIDWLSHWFGYKIKNFAENGDEAGAALTGDQNKKLIEHITEKYVDFIVFSAGGNDIVGQYDLPVYIRDGHLDLVLFRNKLRALEALYVEFMARIKRYSKNSNIRVVTHTYDVPVSLGVPFKVLGIRLAGPWIKPYMEKAGVKLAVEQRAIMAQMLGEYAQMLARVSDNVEGFYVVDTRSTVAANQWADELHPSSKGFKAVSVKLKDKIDSLYKESRY